MRFLQKYIFLLLIMTTTLTFTLIGTYKHKEHSDFTEITISEGDTLWQLANELSDGKRIDKWIDDVMVMNDLDSTMIRSGDRLKVPQVKISTAQIERYELAGDGK
ncbi:LysM peptidoglycan-binding domain-containing protein [Sporosarcina sp. Te-1]|uniref:cell division suppressor protein YneA n=1 Tax=Sporosarcina sp. Te-1 TaxID=2818390 RepID=UPI001A9EA1C0|nr:LysM peptidoglycan-binding domain-containing protein [Sporosarcina sp. Te-1]QTD42246.1 LysM peptidoglycan-binding domain-containing protein [Sporosarcina sp. Te-1]